MNGEDEDCRAERELVNSIHSDYARYPLICRNLRKVYHYASGGRASNVAVKRFSVCVRPGEIFGLLGPNGSGKTTILSMLTGIFPPDGNNSNSGDAWVAGHSVRRNIDAVHLSLGVCPQFDLLWA